MALTWGRWWDLELVIATGLDIRLTLLSGNVGVVFYLFGMEVFYKNYPPELVESLHALAETHALFPLGGSDYHGIERDGERQPGEIPLPDAVVHDFLVAAREQGCEVPEPTPAA